MNAGKAIYYLLSNASSVTDICGTRIYPELAEQGAPTPFVVYEVISVDPDDTNDGPAKLDEVSIDITAVADSYDTCADLASAIRSAIDRVRGTYNGVNVDSIQYSTTDTDVFDSPRRYAMTAGFIIRISRDDAQIATGQPIDLLTILRLADTPSTYGTTGQALVMNAAGDALEWGETASELGDLTNVNLSDLQDHEALVYDQDTATWINGASTKIGIRVINQTGGPLFAALPVRATGVQGDQVTVERFNAASDDPKTFIGLLDSEIANGETGYARQTGAIYNLNTSYFDIGDILYPTTNLFITNEPNSFLTTSVPDTPGAKIACAIVLRKHANTGRVYVRTWTPSRKLEDLDDVNPLILPQFREGKSLVWNINRWIAGSPKLNMSELLDVQTYNPITIPNKQTLRWSSTELEWQVIPEVGGLPAVPNTVIYFLGRYNDEASTARQAADATLTIEHYLSVQADGHGEEITQQTDTPSAGNKIVRKIWHKGVSFEDSDVTTWTLVHTFADDTAYSATEATFDALLTAATYGSIPLTLAQTWEDTAALTGILDGYTDNLVGGFAPALLDSTYTGDCLRVRRASDNAETDIGFDGIDLDTAALATFCAGTDGFVVTWYNQDGSGNNATNSTAAEQPKIYDAATGVELDSAIAALTFDGSNDYLLTSGYLVQMSQNSASVFVVKNATIANDQYILSEADSDSPYSSQFILGDTAGNNRFIWVNATVVGTTTQTRALLSFHYASSAIQCYENGTSAGSATGLTINSEAYGVTAIGGRADGTTGAAFNYNGKIQAVITYSADKSADRAAIETALNSYFNIY